MSKFNIVDFMFFSLLIFIEMKYGHAKMLKISIFGIADNNT